MRNLFSVMLVCTLAAPLHARAVSLDGAVRRSELIVTIQLDTPHTTRVQVPVPPPDANPTKDCGVYESYALTGKVVAVVSPTNMRFTVVSPDERIVVFPGNLPQNVELTRGACTDGTSKSPIYDRFAGGAPLEDGAVRTALLRWEPGYGWIEAVNDSWLASPPTKAKLASVRRMHFNESPEKHDALCVTAADCVQDDLSCEPCGPCVEHPPISSAAVGRYVALCHESKKPKPGSCGGCGDVKSSLGPPTRVACRAMRCALEAVKPKPKATPAPTPAIPAVPTLPPGTAVP